MTAGPSFTRRFLGRSSVSRLLGRCGVEPRTYYLLVDLFETLSERNEFINFGNDSYSLQRVSLVGFLTGFAFSLLLIYIEIDSGTYLTIFVAITAVQAGFLLLAEIAEVIVNPADGLVLAHQPIDATTWTSAKLTHVVRMIMYIVAGLNLAPAILGVFLASGGGVSAATYPLKHLAAALAAGLMAGLACCALVGWLSRFVPASRMKGAAAGVQVFPIVAAFLYPRLADWAGELAERASAIELPAVLTAIDKAAPGGLPLTLGLIGAALAAAVLVMGLRSLAANGLMRAARRVQVGSGTRRGRRVISFGPAARRLAGGQAGRAGFEFLGKMARRDWQFLRNAGAYLGITALYGGNSIWTGWDRSPFESEFSGIHFFPHVFGLSCIFSCMFLSYGNNHKGLSTLFSVPSSSLLPFARGVHAALFTYLAVVPSLALLGVTVPSWGAVDAVLFSAYCIALGSVYLGLSLGLVDGFPFGRQTDPGLRPLGLGVAVLGGIVIAMAVGIQYALFRWHWTVAIGTVAATAGSYYLSRPAISGLQERMRQQIELATAGRLAESRGGSLAIWR